MSGSGVTGASVGQTTAQTDMSQVAGAPPGTSAPAASAQTVLSSVARTLDVISRFGGATPPVSGDAPLWPAPPRSASALAASQNLPPLSAAALATELAKTVGKSGLFYESHLMQWLAGQRSAASLGSEPQARVDARGLSLSLDFANDAAKDATAGHAWLDNARATQFTPEMPDLHAPARTVATPQTPAAGGGACRVSARCAAVRTVEFADSGRRERRGRSRRTAEPAGIRAASVDRGGYSSGDDQHRAPAAGRARQRAVPLAERSLAGHALRVGNRPRAARSLQSRRCRRPTCLAHARITLSLPALGMVDAELVLTGETLAARIKASDAGARRLAADGPAVRASAGGGGTRADVSLRALYGQCHRSRHSGGQKCRGEETGALAARTSVPRAVARAERNMSTPGNPPYTRKQATALAYEAGDRESTPRVIAKGYGMVAEMIVQRAKEAGLYVHESPEMVSVLMQVDLDAHIPPALYQAVAELLSWVYRPENEEPMRETGRAVR
ncbi:MAG: Uncharacterized homolog of the cytoplasmic domain of flagellar protein FhlB [uncultured Caballeronia sp.]|nr:MAG: Uncharacterized homolog of the cytoplasmic domain of flagellar protein FhlB [uncultured Caballeronia sp.]